MCVLDAVQLHAVLEVGRPFLLGILIELFREMRAVLKVELEEERSVAELRLGNGNIGFLAEECVPDRLRARVDVRPRADLLQSKPACLCAERIG